MRSTSLAAYLICTFLLPAWGAAQHNTLLPRPQQIRYGAGQVGVPGLSVQLSSHDAAPEDAFTAKVLAACLSRRTSEPVPISHGEPTGRTIILKRTGPVAALPAPGEHTGPTSREAYVLKVTANGGEIQSASSAGLFYGAQTACQLAAGHGAAAVLPEVQIHDWPSFAYRGTMVDMSHGALPTEQEIKRQLDFLARWKANQYYVYSEASIQLDGFPLLNPQGRLSQDEVRRIVAYGQQRHIDVVPCIETYGHLHDLFRIELYSRLSDFPHGVEVDPSNPQVKTLLANWAAQISSLFPSPFVNIGFDETFQIVQAARRLGVPPGQLYLEQLRNVVDLFHQHGKQVMAWADMMVKFPEVIPEFPHGLIAVPWGYNPQDVARLGIDVLVKAGMPIFVQPGVTSWNQISPDFDTTFANIDTLAAAGRRVHAPGLINSLWEDDAQMLMRASWPGMAYGAAAAWQSAPMDRAAFFSDYAQLTVPAAAAADFAAALGALTAAETDLQKASGDSTMISLWEHPFAPAYFKRLAAHRQDFHETRTQAEEAERRLVGAEASGADPATINSLVVNSRLLDYAGLKFLNAIEIAELWRRVGPRRPNADQWWNEFESQVTYQDHSRAVDLMDAITELRPLYRSAWLAEYTPYRLASALGRWDAEYQYWRSVQARLQLFSDSTHEGESLPPIQEVVGEN
ncbi:MAG: glycoside hydrolase family 20 zincin-like fold domain-containing protein [Terriglobia bacterium]